MINSCAKIINHVFFEQICVKISMTKEPLRPVVNKALYLYESVPKFQTTIRESVSGHSEQKKPIRSE